MYTSETLRLKCALTAPACLDGSGNKLTISLPTDTDKSKIDMHAFQEKRNKMLTLIKNLLENNDMSIMKEIEHHTPSKVERKNSHKTLKKLTINEQELIFKDVMANNTLNLFQKINLFDRLNLRCRALSNAKPALENYFKQNNVHAKDEELTHRLIKLSPRYKFIFCHKLNQYKLSKPKIQSLLVAARRTLRYTTSHETAAVNGRADSEKSNDKLGGTFPNHSSKKVQPLKTPAQITHVAFCTGQYSHLLIACTDNRILIWNLLTLRLQSSLKLCVSKITVDIYTSLVAAFTRNNELVVFLPNTPIPLYQHRNLPKVLGAAWIPRKYPKSNSLNVDWQAISELYFLTEDQVISQACNNYIYHFN